MLDDLDHLRNNSGLLQLLGQYVELGEPDREAWQDRIMQLEGCEPREVTKLHGQLLGAGWIEQNTGHTPILRPDSAPACYRSTSSGVKAFRDAHGLKSEPTSSKSECPFPKKKRKKSMGQQSAEVATP